MIVAAVAAVEVKDLLSAVVSVRAVGLGLTIAFLVLKAPDLAIVQLVVEILVLLIMLRVTIKTETAQKEERHKAIYIFISLLAISIFLIFAYSCLKCLPEFGYPIMKVSKTYVEEALQKTGATNIVSAILLDYRGYDTLGEATILFDVVVGTLVVLRMTGRKKSD